MLNYYTGKLVTIDGVWIRQPVPFSVAYLIDGFSGAQVRANLLEQIAQAQTQVLDPFDHAAVAEKQAYWTRWLESPWLPLTVRTNCINSSFSPNFQIICLGIVD